MLTIHPTQKKKGSPWSVHIPPLWQFKHDNAAAEEEDAMDVTLPMPLRSSNVSCVCLFFLGLAPLTLL